MNPGPMDEDEFANKPALERPVVKVELEVPDGVELVLIINGVEMQVE